MVFTACGGRFLRLNYYSWALFICVLLSIGIIVGFNELEVEVVGGSPLHAGLMALCQYGALTLATKIWFSINYSNFWPRQKSVLGFVIHGGLLSLVVASYWFKQNYPLLPILMYPLASISLALIAETIEEHLQHHKVSTS